MGRLRGFHMREIFAVGTPEQVTSFRDTLLNDQIDFLKHYCINGVVETASDPFFVDDYSAKRMYQMGLELKHEVKMALPYDQTELAVSSLNYHQEFFSKAFNITAHGDSPVHSCCLGFGIDRWCIAIFSQHGLDVGKWPNALQELLK